MKKRENKQVYTVNPSRVSHVLSTDELRLAKKTTKEDISDEMARMVRKMEHDFFKNKDSIS